MSGFISNGPLTDWNDHDAFWHDNHKSRPYAADTDYGTIQPAYRFGYDLFGRRGGGEFGDLNDDDLRAEWEAYEGRGDLDWDRARPAARDAYDRGGIEHPAHFTRVVEEN